MVKIFCSVDTTDFARAGELAAIASKTGIGLKLGLEFFNTHGPQGVRKIRDQFPDLPFFLDLKLHDIPNTVARSVKTLAELEPDYLNVHAGGGGEMMRLALQALPQGSRSKLIAVTVLTSFDTQDLTQVGQGGDIKEQILRLAKLTKDCGLAGVVCSPREVKALRENLGKDFILITPGVRPVGSSMNDQKRVMTPKDALEAGATHLVIGRPITDASDPESAIEKILADL